MAITPARHAASTPARIEVAIDGASTPLTTISSTELTPSGSADFVTARSVGQYASLVEAIIDLMRLEPTLLPLRTTPPGTGRMVEIAPTHSLQHAKLFLHEKFAFHHRDPPIAHTCHHLAHLESITEEP
jgi:hypothetical protein